MQYSWKIVHRKAISFLKNTFTFRRHSIYVKIFVPAIVVMLFQAGIIGASLFVNGTINTLDNSAVDVLAKNAENRAAALERVMVAYWSNLDKLELDIIGVIDKYLSDQGLDITDTWGDSRHETELLDDMSQFLINALRTGGSTGVFMYFLDPDGYDEAPHVCNGLYYRDLDPLTNPANYTDLLFERGHISTARKDSIQLDSLWNETFNFTPWNTDTWRGFINPQIAAGQYKGVIPENLAYWNKPHVLNPGSPLEASECITYNRPFFYGGHLIAMIGSEIQTSQLENYFPASDFDSYAQSGYMLLRYDADSYSPESFSAQVLQVSGSYVRRLIGGHSEIDLTAVRGSESYNISASAQDIEAVRVVFYPLRLYNANTPFSGEQWVLAAIGTERMLFEASNNVSRWITLCTVLTAVVGGLILLFIIRKSASPIISVANQLEKSERDETDVVLKSNTYEIALLTSAINAARERRRLAEAQVLEERERYLIALESATDTFIEYDLRGDSFMLYFFSGDTGSTAALTTQTIIRFMETVTEGGFCHSDDIRNLSRFMEPAQADPIEIRIRTSVFQHITDVTPDGEYYWFLLKASRTFAKDGNVSKIIGTAKEITREKLEEAAVAEVRRRDLTTGVYNREYGAVLIENYMSTAGINGGGTAVVSVIHIVNFNRMETFYGRTFGGIVMSGIGKALSSAVPDESVLARLSNDDFLLYLNISARGEIGGTAEKIKAAVSGMYSGEIELGMRMGSVSAVSGDGLEQLIFKAYTAMNHTAGEGGANGFYEDIPQGGRADAVPLRKKPVSVFLDIRRENIVSLAFELFERTSDVHCAVKVLFSLMGRLFTVRRAVVCAYDSSFGTNQVLYEWVEGKVLSGGSIEKIADRDWKGFKTLLSENDTYFFTEEDKAGLSAGQRALLCLSEGEKTAGYCCEMLENETHTGRIVFFGPEPDWSDEKRQTLHEIVKLIAVHISIEKSHSASRAKSEFLSRISHEIRTPMSAIIGMTDIALNSGDDAKRVHDALGKIDFSAKHLLALINDVLDMSRIESGKLQIVRETFSLDGFTAGIETLMRIPIENNGITFTVNPGIRHTEVIGDEYRLRQVLVNLLGNANKFTEAGGSVVFAISELLPDGEDENEDEACFRFSVKDTGIGIRLEEQPQIFKAFEQAGGSVAGRHNGTGLGLAISANIVSAMGGKIELVSKPGEGSEFFFTIKLALSEGTRAAEGVSDQAARCKNCFTGKRALLVEDVDINVEIALYLLSETGLAIDVAVNGQEAVDRFNSSPVNYYDVILMDIQMPVMDGLSATRHIRRNTERLDARTVPIIAMTANAFDEDMKKSVESGMNGHVAKPLESEKLLSALRQVIDNR